MAFLFWSPYPPLLYPPFKLEGLLLQGGVRPFTMLQRTSSDFGFLWLRSVVSEDPQARAPAPGALGLHAIGKLGSHPGPNSFCVFPRSKKQYLRGAILILLSFSLIILWVKSFFHDPHPQLFSYFGPTHFSFFFSLGGESSNLGNHLDLQRACYRRPGSKETPMVDLLVSQDLDPP